MHILDTDTITHLHAGNLKIVEHLKKTDDSDIRITVITRIELLRGRFEFLSLRKIGRADILIVSIVLSNNAVLVTRNLRHFRQIPGLSVKNWVD